MPAFTAVPTAAAVCATGAVPVFADVDPDTATIDPDCRGRGRHRPHPRGDPGAPLRAAGADARTWACRCSRTPPRPTAPLDPAVGDRPRWRTASIPTKNLGGIGDGGAVVTDDDAMAANLRLLRAHGLTDGYVHERVSTQLRGSPRSRRRRCASGSRASPRRTPVGARSRPATAPRRRTCGGSRRTTAHVYHLCVAAHHGARRVPERGAVRDRRALSAGAHPATGVPGVRRGSRAPKPKRGRRSAYRYRASPR